MIYVLTFYVNNDLSVRELHRTKEGAEKSRQKLYEAAGLLQISIDKIYTTILEEVIHD